MKAATARRVYFHGRRRDGNMQDFYGLNENETVSVAVPKMQKSIESAASCFSGVAFPTNNLQVGMLCMRTDKDNTVYKLVSVNPAAWTPILTTAGQASKLEGTRTIKLTGKAVGSVATDLSSDVTIKVTTVTADTATQAEKATTADIATNATNADNAKNAANAKKATQAEQASKLDHDVTVTLGGIITGSGTTNLSDDSFSVEISDVDPTLITVKNISTDNRLQDRYISTTSGSAARASDSGVDIDYGTSGSGSYTTTTWGYDNIEGVTAGEYTLQSLLQALVNASHNHQVTKKVTKYNCNCNCNCSTNDGE